MDPSCHIHHLDAAVTSSANYARALICDHADLMGRLSAPTPPEQMQPTQIPPLGGQGPHAARTDVALSFCAKRNRKTKRRTTLQKADLVLKKAAPADWPACAREQHHKRLFLASGHFRAPTFDAAVLRLPRHDVRGGWGLLADGLAHKIRCILGEETSVAR